MEESILFKKKEKTSEELKQEKANPLIQRKGVKEKYAPKRGYLLRFDQPQQGVEANYYWILRFMKEPPPFGIGLDPGNGQVIKLKDLHTAGATSAYWGSVAQRRSVQQEKATSLMMTIGKMLKDSFQVLRELRIMDERLELYEKGNKDDLDAENALKDVWITIVEKGTQNPSSVYGMATKVGFVTLPQLFTKAYPKTVDDVGKEVAKFKGINKLLRDTLAKKLKQFMVWRTKTYSEIKTRKRFMLGYLRQHYNAIRVNMNWLRPYLRDIQQLQQKGILSDEDIASSFETSKIELELLGKKLKYVTVTEEGYEEEHDFKKYFPCVLVKINFLAIPQMYFTRDQQRGPMHIGRTELIIQGYVATQEQIDQYKKKGEEEDIEMLGSYAEALGALEEDLVKYLKEGGEIIEQSKEEIEQPQKLFTPITGIFSGFKELLGIQQKPKKQEEKPEIRLSVRQEKIEKKAAESEAAAMAWILYKVFKKGHGMITW